MAAAYFSGVDLTAAMGTGSEYEMLRAGPMVGVPTNALCVIGSAPDSGAGSSLSQSKHQAFGGWGNPPWPRSLARSGCDSGPAMLWRSARSAACFGMMMSFHFATLRNWLELSVNCKAFSAKTSISGGATSFNGGAGAPGRESVAGALPSSTRFAWKSRAPVIKATASGTCRDRDKILGVRSPFRNQLFDFPRGFGSRSLINDVVDLMLQRGDGSVEIGKAAGQACGAILGAAHGSFGGSECGLVNVARRDKTARSVAIFGSLRLDRAELFGDLVARGDLRIAIALQLRHRIKWFEKRHVVLLSAP
jgi:hypothetical protein